MRVPGGNALHGPAAAIAGKLFLGQCAGKAVSYTHLDVYKRQLVVLATSGQNAVMLAVAVALLLVPSRVLACLLSRLVRCV